MSQLSVREILQKHNISITDVHTHLYDERFEPDFDELLQKTKEAGVERILLVSESEESADKIDQLRIKYPSMIFAGYGIHPCCVRSLAQVDKMLLRIRQAHAEKRLACIGEVGLDFTPYFVNRCLEDMKKETGNSALTENDAKELQKEALRRFAALSNELNLPLNVHSRSAGRPCVDLLKEAGAKNVLMHCFDGSAKVAKTAIQAGFKFSIPANIVRSPDLQRVVREAIPLTHLLLETDSPALHPEKPKVIDAQGNTDSLRNEPANILLALQSIAD